MRWFSITYERWEGESRVTFWLRGQLDGNRPNSSLHPPVGGQKPTEVKARGGESVEELVEQPQVTRVELNAAHEHATADQRCPG